jgi:hypothetical protein
VTATPACPSTKALTKPTGPPPAIKTWALMHYLNGHYDAQTVHKVHRNKYQKAKPSGNSPIKCLKDKEFLR